MVVTGRLHLLFRVSVQLDSEHASCGQCGNFLTIRFKLESDFVAIDDHLVDKIGLRTHLFGDKVVFTILGKEHFRLSKNEVVLCLKDFGLAFFSHKGNFVLSLTQNAKVVLCLLLFSYLSLLLKFSLHKMK